MNDIPTNQREASTRAFALAHGFRQEPQAEKGPHGPSRVLVSDREVAELLGASRASIWRRAADGTLPAPIKIGGMTRWVLSEVEAAIAARIAARDAEAA